jgi:hypothetical protein
MFTKTGAGSKLPAPVFQRMQVLTALSLIVTIALQVCILTLLVRHRLQKQFLWFLIYISYALAECILRLAVSGSPQTYFRVYWLTEVLDVVLTLAAVRESFLHIFWPETRQRWFKWVFWSCIALAIAYASWKAWAYPPRQADRIVMVILNLEFALGTSISIFGLLYFGLIKMFAVLEHQRESGIILGFTANASIATFSWITRSVFGTKFRLLSEWIPALAYIVAELTWSAELLQPERKLPEPRTTLEQMNQALDRYLEIFQRYRRRER